ncbi:MAG: peroxiredoxin [Candidatus Heimdallarchaeota archaeon]|nr:peroxiredoxin [Candidatus Heimdallarchaeota archaeon]
MNIKIGDPAPNFCLPETNDTEVCLKDLKGKWAIIYFYPRDNTKGCTLEAIDFTNALAQFENLGAIVLGISPDSLSSHKRFTEKHGLKVCLLSDESKSVLKDYGVWQEKSMYGRRYFGVVRSTVIIDPNGRIAALWEKVRVKEHVKAVLERLKELQAQSAV